MADRAAENPAWVGLELRDDFGCGDLRRTGNRATGKERSEDLNEVNAFSQPGPDRRRHLQYRRPALDVEEPLDDDAPRFGNATEIVPQQIDDHHVLGTLLVGRGQRFRARVVFLEPPPATGRAFHRTR